MIQTFPRRRFIAQAGAIAGALLGLDARAETMPDLATIFVGLAPGGATDAAARRVAEGMRGVYSKNVVVDNRTGAGGRLAVQHVKGASPNGASMLLTPASMLAIYPHTYKSLAYDPIKDLVPVGMVSTTDVAFAVGPGVPPSVKTLEDFLAWVKTSPNGANFGSGATGSGPHFLGELLGQLAKVKLTHAGYRGSQPAILDMLGGHIPAVSAPLGEFLPHLKTGQVRVLAVTGDSRSKFLPDVPTFKERGIALNQMTEWFGVFMPAKTPSIYVEKANAAIKATVARPDVIEALGLMGMESKWTTPKELADRLAADLQRWKEIVQKIGFTAES